MARYDAYNATPPAVSASRGWILFALIGSGLVHAGVFYFCYTTRLQNFGPVDESTPQRRELINVKQVKIDPKTLEPEKTVLTQSKKSNVKPELFIPSDAPKPEEMHIAPARKPLDSSLIPNDKPALEMAAIDQTKVKSGKPEDALPKLDDTYFAPNRSGPKVAALDSKSPVGGDGTANAVNVGNQSVGQILDKLGSGTGGNPVLSLPGNTTFDYDSAFLGAEGRDAMSTVAEVFKKFLGDALQTATFVITGHTDSFGSLDYNQQLSEQRAESVKAWLVTNVGISPDRVQTKGLGNSKPLVSSEGTIEEQSQNRRVEIVIRRSQQ